MSLATTRKLTCRYWALGSACPDVAPGGRIFCQYAHYDTGTLCDAAKQMGTCLPWSKKGVCLRSDCPYEHRETGVTGLNQGGRKSLQLRAFRMN